MEENLKKKWEWQANKKKIKYNIKQPLETVVRVSKNGRNIHVNWPRAHTYIKFGCESVYKICLNKQRRSFAFCIVWIEMGEQNKKKTVLRTQARSTMVCCFVVARFDCCRAYLVNPQASNPNSFVIKSTPFLFNQFGSFECVRTM